MMEYWYKYRDDLWKIVTIYESKEKSISYPSEETPDQRLKTNIRRAARQVEAYALCNDWDWFGTFTLNKSYRDRTDLDAFRRAFMQFLRDNRKVYGRIDALLVPELHKNRSGWHMHGLVKGLPQDALQPFILGQRLPKYIRKKLKAGEPVFDWPRYRDSFGWVDIEPIKNRDAAARYITKYLTKDSQDVTAKSIDSGKHLYYVTRGLKQPEKIENAPGEVPKAFPMCMVAGNRYTWEYGEVQWLERPRF